jgi:hypothetical protein
VTAEWTDIDKVQVKNLLNQRAGGAHNIEQVVGVGVCFVVRKDKYYFSFVDENVVLHRDGVGPA